MNKEYTAYLIKENNLNHIKDKIKFLDINKGIITIKTNKDLTLKQKYNLFEKLTDYYLNNIIIYNENIYLIAYYNAYLRKENLSLTTKKFFKRFIKTDLKKENISIDNIKEITTKNLKKMGLNKYEKINLTNKKEILNKCLENLK